MTFLMTAYFNNILERANWKRRAYGRRGCVHWRNWERTATPKQEPRPIFEAATPDDLQKFKEKNLNKNTKKSYLPHHPW